MAGLIAHEWIERRGGSENVLEAIAELYPDAELVTPWNNAPHRFAERHVRELWLANSPLRGRKAASVPALAAAWRSAVPRERPLDWVLASSHLFAHHIKPHGVNKHVPKLVYVYTPARYIWTPDMDQRGSHIAARIASAVLRPIDRHRAKEAHAVASISEFVRQRVRRAWQVDSTVIYPPVEVTRLREVADWSTTLDPRERELLDSLPEEFVLGASRFIPYKRLDLVIAAAEEAGIPAVIAGGGPERTRLSSLAADARVPVRMVDEPSSALLHALYQRATVFVFPPVEDFGIMPIEAMALGTPAVGAAIGGSAETITDGISGAHFTEPTARNVAQAIARAREVGSASTIAASMKFSRERFDTEFRDWLNRSVSGTKSSMAGSSAS
ncbi:glycosyltransferase [Leifsonia sp. NPDC077715]|uniref:glycosyltransferase n=1 Tax=Leifsonia sp. NPDC077715 TaxID=3155539 RepID=UPI003441B0F8